MEEKKGLQDRLFGGLFANLSRAQSRMADAQQASKYH